MKKIRSIMAELNSLLYSLRLKLNGRNIYHNASTIATILAICAAAEEDDIPEIFKEMVETELEKLRREVML